MANTRKVVTRLFPLENIFSVAKAKRTDDPDEKHNTIYTVDILRAADTEQPQQKTKTGNRRGFFGTAVLPEAIQPAMRLALKARGESTNTDESPFMLPSGYYIHESTHYAGHPLGSGLTDPGVATKHHKLSNIFCDSTFGSTIKEPVDMSLCALVRQETDFHQLAVVSKDKSRVYLYDLTISNDSSEMREFRISPHYTERTDQQGLVVEEHTGLIIRQGRGIASIVGFPKSGYLAIADQNDIVVGKLKNGRIVNESRLSSIPSDVTEAEPAKLFAGANDTLIAYQPLTRHIIAWDLNAKSVTRFYSISDHDVRKKIAEMACPPLFNLSMSTDGKYLTGLEKLEGDESTILHCYEYSTEASTLKHHKIVLDEPVADCVIGHEGQVYTIGSSDDFDIMSDFTRTVTNGFRSLEGSPPSLDIKRIGHIQDILNRHKPEAEEGGQMKPGRRFC